MKKILFILQSFEIGGTTVSISNLISVLDKNKYDIYVWVLDDRGELRWMYKDLQFLPTCFVVRSLALNGWKSVDGVYRRCLSAFVRLLAKCSFFKRCFFKHSVKRCIGSKHFDTVVASQEGLTTYLTACIPCDNHVAWVRCDYKRVYEAHGFIAEDIYSFYNHIVCVANNTRDSFVEIYPNYDNKTVCIYNPQDSNFIKANAEIDDHDPRFNCKGGRVIVSLGRLDSVKRFDRIPSIAKSLLEKGLSFMWYIIGDGGEKQRIADEIIMNSVGANVFLLGAKSNPHYYIKKADLYVCLSSSEACPRVINEAKILGTPVVSTDFPTVYEYLEDGVNGRISSLEDIPQAIEEILTDKIIYSRMKKEIENFSFDNAPLISKLEEVL